MLEQAAYLLNMVSGPASRGRKANGYKKFESVKEIKKFFGDN